MPQPNETLQRLIELQKLDLVIRDLSAEIERLPKEIAQIESTLAQHVARVEADKKALADNQMSRRKREGEITSLREKISHLKGQSTQVKTNDQYKAMLHEIEYNEQQIVKIEDQILVEMEASESLAAKLKETEASLAAERAQVAEEVARAKARKAADEQTLAAHRQQREALKSGVDIAVFERYEHILKARKGVAVTAIVDRDLCGACHVRMRPAALSQAIGGNHLISCESCDRFLYYVPPATEDV
jgi:uncharacterized protein